MVEVSGRATKDILHLHCVATALLALSATMTSLYVGALRCHVGNDVQHVTHRSATPGVGENNYFF